MILEIIPKIEYSPKVNIGKHYIYENYNNHLKKIYSENLARKSESKLIKNPEKHDKLLMSILNLIQNLSSNFKV